MRRRAEPVRRARRRGGPAHQGGGRGRGRGRLAGPGEGARVAPQGARDGRRPRRPRHRRRRGRLRPGRDDRVARRARSSGRAPTSSCSASRRATRTAPCSGRPSPTGCGCRSSPRPRARARRRQGEGQAPDRVRLRRHRGADAGRRRRLGRHQRAALPVAQGDHGREAKPQERCPLADLGLDADAVGEAGSRTEVLRARRPAGARATR